MTASRGIGVLHLGAGRYDPNDRTHSTSVIWRELAQGFRSYHVIGRSNGAAAEWTEGSLKVTLLSSGSVREVEFLRSQFRAVPIGLAERPGVIVCQSPVLGGLAALAIARRTTAKVLMELHGHEFFAPARFGSAPWFLQQISHYALPQADSIRVLSNGMKRALLDRYGSRLEQKTHVVPPRVDLQRFAPALGRGSNPVGERLKVAMVGGVNANKGQIRLVSALEQGTVPIDLHIAGTGPDLEACRAREAQSGGTVRVHCHGSLEPDAVADMLRQCDVLVVYSLREATPRALMEGMASGLAVVTTNVGFCSELIENAVEGIVLGPQPDSEIACVLARLHADPTLRQTLGLAARKRAERDFDSKKLFAAYRKLITRTAAV